MSQPTNIKRIKGIKFRELLQNYSPDELLFAPIEVAKHEHVASFVNYYGEIIIPHFSFPNNKQGVKLYLDKLNKASTNMNARKTIIGLESSGHYHENLLLSLENKGHDVVLFNPYIVWKERDSHIRKTDFVDLNPIASALIHNRGSLTKLKRDIQYKLQRAARTRRKFVQHRAQYKAIIKSLVDRIFPGYQDENDPLFSDFWGKTSLLILEKYPAPQRVISMGVKRLTHFFKKHNTKLGRPAAEKLVARAKNSLSRDYHELEIDILVLKKYLKLIKELSANIEKLEQQIARLFIQTPGVYLLSIRGISLIYASELMSEIGSFNYYRHYRQILDLAGASSKIRQSGQYEARGLPISGHGNKYLRTVINQIGNGLKSNGPRGCPYFSSFGQKLLDRGKHPRCVNFAVGSKFVRIAVTMVKSKSFFKPPNVKNHIDLNQKDFMISTYYSIIKKLSNFSSNLPVTEDNYLSKIRRNIESKYDVKLKSC